MLLNISRKQSISIILLVLVIGSLFLVNNQREKEVFKENIRDCTENPSVSPSDLLPPAGGGSETEKNFIYSGQNKTDTLLSYEGLGLLNSDITDDISITTHDWNVSDILVNFTDIHEEAIQLSVENQLPPSGYAPIFNRTGGIGETFYAMEFALPESCFIFRLKVFLRYLGNFSIEAKIFSAVQGVTPERPKPLGSGFEAVSQPKSLTTSRTVVKAEWVEFTFVPRDYKAFLDILRTEGLKFFVVLDITVPGYTDGEDTFIDWGFVSDIGGDGGSAYVYQGNTWILNAVDLLLTNISCSQVTWTDMVNVEEDGPDDDVLVFDEGVLGDAETQNNAQQFQTNTMSYLTELEVYLRYKGNFLIWAEIYNASASTHSNPGAPIPDTLLFSSEAKSITALLTEISNWEKLSFPKSTTSDSTFLNLYNTYDATFFVVMKAESQGGVISRRYVRWGYMRDDANGDSGLAYYEDLGHPPEYWTLYEANPDVGHDIDLLLRNIKLQSYEKNPSEVSLTVNGTPIMDYSTFNFGGSAILNGMFDGTKGTIYLDVDSTPFTYFWAVWICTFKNQTYSNTQFIANSISATVSWNITIFTNYPKWNATKDGYGLYFAQVLNVTIPLDYTIDRVKYRMILIPQNNYWKIIPGLNKKFLKIENFSLALLVLGYSGNWLISATSPNHIEELRSYNGSKEAIQFYVGEKMNVTAKLKYQTNTPANLMIYNRSLAVVNSSIDTPDQNRWAQFPLWLINKNGTHYVVAYWSNGTEVGIKSLTRMCVFHTNLTKLYSNIIQGIPFKPSETIFVDVFYNDTDNVQGIRKATIDLNLSQLYYNVQEDLGRPGVYNISIFPQIFENGNHTLRIKASRPGYNESIIFIQFGIYTAATAKINITAGGRYISGKWWVDPDPYFDDQSHTITVFYANETNYGIKFASILASPNWTSTTWFGNPTNSTPGFYDIQVDTLGLHEGDIGMVLITAYSQEYETKTVKTYLNITEIPISLLYIDAGPFINITAYEGEVIDIAVGFWDDFHENPILFENPSEGNLTWEICGTNASGFLERSVWQYETTISLPFWQIFGTKTYDITIIAIASRDYAMYETNLTLNVLSKENTSLMLTNSTPTEYRVGHSFYLFANLTLENGTALANQKVDFNISQWNNGQIFDYYTESRFTNPQGIATYLYFEIPDGIDEIQVNATYAGTEKIDPASKFQSIPILPKYNVSILLMNYTPGEYRVGQELYLFATLVLENGSVLVNQKVDLSIKYYENNISRGEILDSRYTNGSGMVSYHLLEIPDYAPINKIIFEASFSETTKIQPGFNSTLIPIGPKYNISILLMNYTPGEYRVGQELYLFATLVLENGSVLVNQKVDLSIKYYENNISRGEILDSRYTNEFGMVSYHLLEIPDHVPINKIIFEASFSGTNKIEAALNNTMIPIGPKYNVSLVLLSNLSNEIMVGSTLKIEVQLQNAEKMTPLANETIEFLLIYDGNSKSRKATTNGQGIAFVEIEISSDMADYNSFTIKIIYEGSSSTNDLTLDTQTQITIMTWTKRILGILPYVGIVAAVVIGSYLVYRQGVVAPRRRRRLSRMEKLASKFRDIVNLQHLLVIHGKSGSCLYQYSFGESTLDADLISGFLTAISAFQTEIQAPKGQKLPFGEKLPPTEEKKEEQGFELSYANFKILLRDGKLIRTALILAVSATDSVREAMITFVSQFETKYKEHLKDWKGAVGPFKTADTLIESTFETSLLWPHRVEKTSDQELKKLNSLESSLVTLALTIQQEKHYFFLPSIITMAGKVRRESQVEILGTIDDLRQKGLFRAIPLDVIEDYLESLGVGRDSPTSI